MGAKAHVVAGGYAPENHLEASCVMGRVEFRVRVSGLLPSLYAHRKIGDTSYRLPRRVVSINT